MYIRFSTDRRDADTGQPSGVFLEAYRLLDDEALPAYQCAEIRETLNWFKSHLPIPDQFSRSRSSNRQSRGVCWFKSTAADCLKQIRYLCYLVAEQDVLVKELTTNTPGYVVYEDEYQVVAESFASTPK